MSTFDEFLQLLLAQALVARFGIVFGYEIIHRAAYSFEAVWMFQRWWLYTGINSHL